LFAPLVTQGAAISSIFSCSPTVLSCQHQASAQSTTVAVESPTQAEAECQLLTPPGTPTLTPIGSPMSAAVAVPGAPIEESHAGSAEDPVLQFFHSATAYDIMPENGKVVVVDADLSLAQLLRIFVEQRATCVVVWVGSTGSTVLLDTMHLIKVLLQYSSEVELTALGERLAANTVAEWLASQEGFVGSTMPSVAPDLSLYEAINQMEEQQIQRLPVVDTSTAMAATVLHIITFPRILRYVMAHFHDDNDELLNRPIEELRIGAFDTADIMTVGSDTSLKEVFQLMADNSLQCVPIVDEDGVVVDVISQKDVTLAARSVSYECMERPARSLLLEHGNPQESLHTCMRSEALISVLRRLLTTGADRLICVDFSGHLEGVVTLNHIFGHFIQRPPTSEAGDAAETNVTEPAEGDEEEDVEHFGRFCVTDLSD